MYLILESEKSIIMRKELQIGLIIIVFVLFVSNVLTLRKINELEEFTQTKTDKLEENIGYFAQTDYISGSDAMRMINDHIWWDHQSE